MGKWEMCSIEIPGVAEVPDVRPANSLVAYSKMLNKRH
jgi:hypothetical protein